MSGPVVAGPDLWSPALWLAVQEGVDVRTGKHVRRGQRVHPGATGAVWPVRHRGGPGGDRLDDAGSPRAAAVDPHTVRRTVTDHRGHGFRVALGRIDGWGRHALLPAGGFGFVMGIGTEGCAPRAAGDPRFRHKT